jgi:transposase
MERKAYPSDISDEEWGSVAPYLTLMTEEAPQRDFSLREVFNGLRWLALIVHSSYHPLLL